MKKKRKRWTQQEKELLRKIYPTYSWDEMMNIFNDNKDGITHKAKQLGVKRQMVNCAKYSQEDIRFIKNNYGKIPTESIAEQLGRTKFAIETKARKMGCKIRTLWEDDEIKLLKENFSKYSNVELNEIFFPNRSIYAIDSMAAKLNLKKNIQIWIPQKSFSKEKILNDLKSLYNTLGRTPLLVELQIYGLSSERTLLRYFPQGYKKLCKSLGWQENKTMFGRQGIFYSKNNDICYSKTEVAITDFLIDNNIKYKKEESLYKDIYHIEEFGTKRTDWILDDDISLEYFGFWGRTDYDKKVQEKIDLCKKYNIKLISIFPNNLKDLRDILKDYIK